MGGHHKKRNAAVASPHRSTEPISSYSPLPAEETAAGGSPAAEDDEGAANEAVKSPATPSPDVSVKVDCEKALIALRRGNHTKALRITKEACGRHESSALLHRVHGTICLKIASLIEDAYAKQRHLKNAIESANKAVTLSPNSIEFAHFYASLLYEAANDSKGYEEVVQACERALAIQDPIDPAKESLQDKSQQRHPTPQARIAHMQQEVNALIQKANIASISTWMKNLGNGAGGEEKFRLIPVRTVAAEDPMELRLVQSRRPNEIKKVTKTPEERRKEIEVRVAAARILQQKSDAEPPKLPAVGNKAPAGPHRGESRRRSSRKLSTKERMDGFWSFWQSMDVQKRRGLLRVNVHDLELHCTSMVTSPSPLSSALKDRVVAVDLLQEAISFADKNKTWSFWLCCRCMVKFVDEESHMHHVVREHMGNLAPKSQAVFPSEVGDEWVDLLLNGSWKPVDVDDALKLLSSACSSNGDVELHPVGEHLFAKNEYSSFKSKEEDGCLKQFQNCTLSGEIGQGEEVIRAISDSQAPDDVMLSREMLLSLEWPVADDVERLKLLEKIHSSFQILIKHKCLAAGHLNKVVQYVIEELQGLMLQPLVNHVVGLIPLCICFLGAAQLRKVVMFLQDLAHSCGLNRYQDKSGPVDTTISSKGDEICEQIVLSDDSSFLVVNGHSLSDRAAGVSESRIKHAEGIDGREREREDGFFESDAVLSWIISKNAAVDQLVGWQQRREEKIHQGQEILQTLEKEFDHLQRLCERKCEHLNYKEALSNVESLCIAERKKREQSTNAALRSYEAILRKWHEDIAEGGGDRLELDFITKILNEAQDLNVNQFRYDDSVSGVTSWQSDVDSPDASEWKMQDFVSQMDSCIEVAIQRQKERLSLELNKIDARIMRNVYSMQQLEIKMGPVSSLDYHTVVVPLIKSFLRAHVEDLLEKDATEKSDAVREAFLAELARDKQKHSVKGGDVSKQLQDRAKDRKKSKDHKRIKGPKVLNADEHHFGSQETEALILDPVADDQRESGSITTSGDHDLMLQEEEHQRQIELEAEERKLEQTLEFQRRIEEEAKLKLFDDQNKRSLWKCIDDVQGHTLVCNSESVQPRLSEKLREPVQKTIYCDKSLIFSKANGFGSEALLQVSPLSSDHAHPSRQQREFLVGSERSPSHGKTESPSNDNGPHMEVYTKSPENLVGVAPSLAQANSFASHSSNGTRMKVPKSQIFSTGRRKPGLHDEGDAMAPLHAQKSRRQVHNSQDTLGLPERNIKISLSDKENHGIKCLKSEALGKEQLQKSARDTFNDGKASTTLKSELSNANGTKQADSAMARLEDGPGFLYSLSYLQWSIISINTVGNPFLNQSLFANVNVTKQADSAMARLEDGPDTVRKTLRRRHAEEEDEERFQADLQKAVKESLDTYQAQHGSQPVRVMRVLKESSAAKVDGSDSTEGTTAKTDAFGAGLQNEVGEYNCFLNVIIQSLWHIMRFRAEFFVMSRSVHMHVGEPCVVCALGDIFSAMSMVAADLRRESISPTCLRIALSNLYPDSNFFQEAQMNDASEVLAVIFECLHRSCTAVSDAESVGSSSGGSWDCTTDSCIAHSLFGMDVYEQMHCCSCGLESRHLKYTSFFHNINANALRTMKITCPDGSFDELLKLVEMNHQLACNPDDGGCGKLNYIHHILSASPYIFTIVLGWQTTSENVDDISATIAAIRTEMDVGVIYHGLDIRRRHQIVSVVCYYGQHYHCFAYSHERNKWIMCDDANVKVIGSWDDVLDMCRKGHLQPQVLFYEAVN